MTLARPDVDSAPTANEAADAPEGSISALPGALADATDIDHETIGDIDFDDGE